MQGISLTHQEQLGVLCLAQGHFIVWTGRLVDDRFTATPNNSDVALFGSTFACTHSSTQSTTTVTETTMEY